MEESDDDVQHDEDSAGRGAAPSFDRKLKHYKVFEGMPVTFSCKVDGDPKPKVRGGSDASLWPLSPAPILTSQLNQRSSVVTGLLVQGRQTDLQEERALQDQPRRRRDLFPAHRGGLVGRRWQLHHHGEQPRGELTSAGLLIILRRYRLVTLALKMHRGQTFVSRHVFYVLPSPGCVMEHQRLLILPSVSGPGELHRQDDGPGREPARPQQALHAGTHAQVTAWETICRAGGVGGGTSARHLHSLRLPRGSRLKLLFTQTRVAR